MSTSSYTLEELEAMKAATELNLRAISDNEASIQAKINFWKEELEACQKGEGKAGLLRQLEIVNQAINKLTFIKK